MTSSEDGILAAIAHDSFLRDLGLGSIGHEEGLQAACERLIDSLTDVIRHNVDQYGLVADQLEHSGLQDLRSKLAPALWRDLNDYDPTGAPVTDRGRERLYWLAVAFADRQRTDGDIDLREVLGRTASASLDLYRPVYQRLLDLTGREPRDGADAASVARLQNIIAFLLEGVTVARRAGMPVVKDDVVTAAIALFFTFSRRQGEPAFDPAQALTEHAPPFTATRQVVAADGAADSYGLATESVRNLRPSRPGVLRHASFHGLSGVARSASSRPTYVVELREAMLELLQQGWKLQRLVTIYSEEDLLREVDAARELATHGRVRVHATAGGVGGHAATISADDHFVIVGLDDPHSGYVERAVRLDDPAAVAFWKDHFIQVFDDRRHTFVLHDPSGLRNDHIAELRARVRGLGRIAQVDHPVVHLTDRQREIADCLCRVPRPTKKEIAQELYLSPETVKQHISNLYDKFDIPHGADRLGPLIDELRRRGVI